MAIQNLRALDCQVSIAKCHLMDVLVYYYATALGRTGMSC